MFGVIFLILFFPLYFFRLSLVPAYQIPEDSLVKIRGRITQQPYLTNSYQIINLGPIMIKTRRFPGYFYGQKIEVIGKFERRVINKFWIKYTTYFPTIQVVDEEKSGVGRFDLTTILLKTRGRIERAIGELLPDPQASLLLGIVFGAKRQMPEKFWQNLRRTGTIHIVVASGQNVTMVARVLIGVLVWVMSRRRALALAILGVALYVLMVGAEPPVVRAGIMATFAYVAQILGREEEGTIALLLTAAIMLLISPLILFDIGFQLSFAATAGILWLYPLFKDTPFLQRSILFRVPVFGEALATTIAAQLGVMPLILTSFGQLSFLSPLVNGAVAWVVPIVMVLGSIMVALALIVRPLAQVLGWFAWALLTYFVQVIEISGNLPWASLEVGQLSFWWAIGYYLVLVYLIWRWRTHSGNVHA